MILYFDTNHDFNWYFFLSKVSIKYFIKYDAFMTNNKKIANSFFEIFSLTA